MKIVIRHGLYNREEPMADNFLSFLSLQGIQQIRSAREKIKGLFAKAGKQMPSKVYCSHADRTVESAILLLFDDGEERIKKARDRLIKELKFDGHKRKRIPDLYFAMKQPGLENIIQDDSLETYVPPYILALDDAIIVLHAPAAESLRLMMNSTEFKLEEGEFAQIDA